jgi:hypothetical protein
MELKRDVLLKARERSVLTPEERIAVDLKLQEATPQIHTLDVTLDDFPVSYWRALLDDARLSANQRAIVARHVFGMRAHEPTKDEIYESEVSNPVEFGSTFATLGNKSPNCEMFQNGRWYPVIVNCQFIEDEGKVARDVVLTINLSICELAIPRSYHVYRDLFLDETGRPITRSVADVLGQFGLRRLQITAAEFNLRLVKAERQSRETGALLLVSGPVLAVSRSAWWSGMESRSLGNPQSPTKAIVEAELEVDHDRRDYFLQQRGQHQGVSRLPFVRLFCLEIKRYVYADIDDLAPYQFDTEALESLCLPADMLSVLSRVFATPVENVFGDLIRGKHGGVVILATGKPGVGKTLTAEIYAERTERPLYVLEMGELGTTASEVETQLRNVFARVTRWNAVLQFDECEIFLSRRNQDLERSAIVGIFLRLLDYYQGMLFLTSNRPEVIDDAVLSRVMLRMDYPDLNRETRAEIWRNMFQAAGLQGEPGLCDALADRNLNGRQIRNLTRLAKILHHGKVLGPGEMEEVFRYGVAVSGSGTR